MNDIIEIVKSLKDSGLLLKGVTEAVQNEVKEEVCYQVHQVQGYQENF